MKTNSFAHYSINDFDSFDCLKLSKGIYLALIFILRGYLVWLISVANMKDHTSVLVMVFPEQKLFYMSLISGSLGLFVLLLISLRKPKSATWVKKVWPQMNYLLITALMFDLIIMLYAYYIGIISSAAWLICQLILVSFFIKYCLTSKRLKINLSEFPEPFIEK